MKKHYAVISGIVCQLSISGISTTYAEEPSWKWIVVDPPTTLPTLIAKGGALETVFAGRGSQYIPAISPDNDFTFAAFYVVLDGKLYRCFTQDGKAKDDGNCFVAVNTGAN